MSIHIIGSNSYIAKRLIHRLDSHDSVCSSVIKYAKSGNDNCLRLDLMDESSYSSLLINKNDYVVILAAISSPDACESDYELAYAINVIGTGRLIDIALSAGAKVLFLSSDTVLGEVHAATDETYLANPFGVYAKMKYEIEQKYKAHSNFKVFRLSYVFSCTDKFTSFISQCYESKAVANVFNTLFRNVIYVEDVVEAIIKLYEKFDMFDNYLFHIVGERLLSRFDIATELKTQVWNSLIINIEEPPLGFLTKRPSVIYAKSLYLQQLLGRAPTPFIDAIKREFRKD